MSRASTKGPSRGLTTRMTVALSTSLVLVSGLLIALIINFTSSPTVVTKYPMATFVPSTTLRIGSKLPPTPTLHDLAGTGSAGLAVIAAHRPMVINFFASYCTACAEEMRNFAQVSSAEHTVAFVGIDTTDPNVAKARSLITGAGITYPVLLDNSASVMMNSFGISNLPTTFFVSASGRVVEEVLGLESVGELRANLAKI
ncbi:MAG TPA: TlpA disulfide reductase family protein [Acidimicrobiales bacterium]|nr:TlpA disulfide reductase family protein [Acidimicrobiales bacterium]